MTAFLDVLESNRLPNNPFSSHTCLAWHHKTVLESLALIASKVCEAVGECFGPTSPFGE